VLLSYRRRVSLRGIAFRVVTGLHRAVFRLSRGRLLGRAGGMPVVILTTVGHRSGRKRRTMLTAPLVDGERVVLVASYGGHSHNPHWFQNLLLQPMVRLTMGGTGERPMRARVAARDERAELWPRIVDAYPGYERYQRKTERQIPLVVLEPYAGRG
jgi:deazaflavin-dependent oxidoreductase (nitroreductase family)